MNEFELARRERTEPISVYGQIHFGEEGKRSDACSAVENVRDTLFAKLEKDAAGIGFEFSGMPLLSELAEGTFQLGDGGAEEMSESI